MVHIKQHGLQILPRISVNMSCLIQQITRGVDPCDFALFTVNNDYQARYRKGGGFHSLALM